MSNCYLKISYTSVRKMERSEADDCCLTEHNVRVYLRKH